VQLVQLANFCFLDKLPALKFHPRAYIVSEIEDLRAAHVQLGRVLDNIEAKSFADEQ